MLTTTLRRATVAATAALVAMIAVTATPAAAEETGSISGVVVDEDGLPVEGVLVNPTRAVPGVTTGADGTYRIDGLMPGDHRFEFLPPAGSGLVSEFFDGSATFDDATVVVIEPGQHVDGIDVALVLGGTVTGRVVGNDGTPVVGEKIEWSGPRPNEDGSVTTGLDGTFTVSGLGADRDYYFFFEQHFGEWLSVPSPYVVHGEPGSVTVLPDIVLTWNGLVTGRALDAQGNPVAGVEVELVSNHRPHSVRDTGLSAADGTYQLRGSSIGDFMVRTSSTVTSSGLGTSPVPTYWSAAGATLGQQGAGLVELESRKDIVKGIDLTVPRTGSTAVDLGATVLHSGDVELSTVQLAATGASGIPSGLVEVRRAPDGYLYGSVRLDATGKGRLVVGLGTSPPALSLLYSGDGSYAPTDPTIQPSSFAPYPPASGVVAMEPRRLVDQYAQPGVPQCARVAGAFTIPSDAVGAIVNVTAVGGTGPGYLVVYPDTGGEGPAAPPAHGATVNFEPGLHVSNAAFVALSDDGYLCWASPAGAGFARIVIDVMGYIGADAGIALRPHERILDTRATGAVRPRTLTHVQVTGRAGVPADATAVLLNVAVTQVRSGGHLRIQPGAVGEAVTTHYVPGADKSVAALATLSPTGGITLWSETGSDVHVVLDVVGWVAGSDVYHAITPERILDSRPGAPAALRQLPGPLVADQVYSMPVRGEGVVPAEATAVALSVTAIGPDNVGNLVVYPDSDGTGKTPRPGASNINYIPGRNIPNFVIAALPPNGRLNLVSQMPPGGTVNVAIEVVGYFTD